MTPTDSQARHLKYGRFGRRQTESTLHGSDPRRRGHWTGYHPLEDAMTQARLPALIETAKKQTEERS